MQVKTLEALFGSIQHYRDLVAGRTTGVGLKECALCARFNILANPEASPGCCRDGELCPVRERTGLSGCRGTPWEDIERHVGGGSQYALSQNCPKCRDLVQQELEFLESLVPDRYRGENPRKVSVQHLADMPAGARLLDHKEYQWFTGLGEKPDLWYWSHDETWHPAEGGRSVETYCTTRARGWWNEPTKPVEPTKTPDLEISKSDVELLKANKTPFGLLDQYTQNRFLQAHRQELPLQYYNIEGQFVSRACPERALFPNEVYRLDPDWQYVERCPTCGKPR